MHIIHTYTHANKDCVIVVYYIVAHNIIVPTLIVNCVIFNLFSKIESNIKYNVPMKKLSYKIFVYSFISYILLFLGIIFMIFFISSTNYTDRKITRYILTVM